MILPFFSLRFNKGPFECIGGPSQGHRQCHKVDALVLVMRCKNNIFMVVLCLAA